MSPEDQSDELFARLREADPGAHLPPADPDRVARVLEDVMSDNDTLTPRASGTRGRNPLTWLVAAAAAVLIAAGGAFALLGGDDPVAPPPTAGEAPTVTALALPPDAPGRCMVPSPEVLGGAAYAVAGEVTMVEGGTATIEPTQWYAGEETDVVEVDAGSADLAALIGAPEFVAGERYLVAGNQDGKVLVCGFSGPWSEDLAQLYDAAFAG